MDSINGIKIIQYDPGLKYTQAALTHHISKYNRLSLIRAVCDIKPTFNFRTFNTKFPELKDIPIIEEICSFALLNIIIHGKEKGNDLKKPTDLVTLYNMCYYLYYEELIEEKDRSPEKSEEIFYLLWLKQFPYQDNIFNTITRSFHLYMEIWNKVDDNFEIGILENIFEITGCRYTLMLCLSYQLLGNPKCYFYDLNEENEMAFFEAFSHVYNRQEHDNFLNWLSADYTFYNKIPLLNPLHLKPILKTTEKPIPQAGSPYIILSHWGLMSKISTGLYYCLSDRYNKGGKKNRFKEIYGHVFQYYVGELFKYYGKEYSVFDEILYTKNKSEADSCDFIVIKNETAILVEVKQSSLKLESKISGDREIIAENVESNLFKGVDQLNTTYDEIQNREFVEFRKFWNIKKFYGLIVCGDTLSNANSFIRGILENKIKSKIPYHIISINDLEILLDLQNDSKTIFDIIINKTQNYNKWDFMAFIENIYPNKNKGCKFLSECHNRLFDEILPGKREFFGVTETSPE